MLAARTRQPVGGGFVEFRSLSDLSRDVVAWLPQLPRSYDAIVGIPRSGMVVASVLALHMNLPLMDLATFVSQGEPWGGRRLRGTIGSPSRVLIVDDTVATGA